MLALGASAWLLGQLVTFQYGRDQGVYGVVGSGLLRGQAPYRDLWDLKPPGIFFVYAFAESIFGQAMYAVRIVEAVGFASLLAAFAILSRRYVGSSVPGLFGGVCALLTHVSLEFWHTGQPESFAAVAISWALVCATVGVTEDRVERTARKVAAWLAAGALYALAALLKPPLGGGIVVSGAAAGISIWRAGRSRRRWIDVLMPGGIMMVGAALPALLVFGYFAMVGALPDLYETLFVFVPHYTALGLGTRSPLALVARAAHEWLTAFSILSTAGLLLLLALPPIGDREREGTLHVLGVIACVLLGVAIQAKFFPYHYGAALVLTGLLGGWGFWKLWLRHRLLAATLFGGLVWLSLSAPPPVPGIADVSLWTRCRLRTAAWFDPARRQETLDRLSVIGEVDAASNRRVAMWLRQSTPRDASVYVWGFEPVIYELAQRRPASHYIYNAPQRASWSAESARAELLRELRSASPAAIVIERGDRLSWVTGDERDSAEVLHDFPAFEKYLQTSYEAAGAIGRFDLYLRHEARAAG